MTPEQLQELALNLSSVTEHLRRQNEGAAARIAQASQQLDQSASRLSADVDPRIARDRRTCSAS